MADQNSYFIGFDLDSGGGTENVLGVALRLSNSGGSQAAEGQKAMASSIPVVLASDQSALDVSGATVTVDSELPTAAALTDNFSNPTAPGVGAFTMLWDGATWDRAPGNSADGMLVNLGSNNDVTVTGTVTVDSELPSAAALADDTANPTVPGVGSFLLGYDSGNTNWNRVEVDDAGHLQVDVLSGAGSDTPTNPVVSHQTSASLAAGASVDLDTAEAASKALRKVVCWCSVAYRVRIYTVDNGVESTNPVAVGGGQAHQAFTFETPYRSYVTLGATAGADNFRAEFTNLDDNLAADVYATFYYEDV